VVNAPLKSGRVPGRERLRPTDFPEAFWEIADRQEVVSVYKTYTSDSNANTLARPGRTLSKLTASAVIG
jgi:hypothetical protein